MTEFYMIHGIKEKAESVRMKAESIIHDIEMAADVSDNMAILQRITDESAVQEYNALCNRRNTK